MKTRRFIPDLCRLSNVFSGRHCVLILVGVFLAMEMQVLAENNEKKVAGILFLRSYVGEKDEFAVPMEFSALESYFAVINVTNPMTGKVSVIEKEKVAGTVMFLNFGEKVYLKGSHFDEVRKWKDEVLKMATRFPKGVPFLRDRVGNADEILAAETKGGGWYKGRVLSQVEVVEMAGSAAGTTGTKIKEMTLGGLVYRDVSLTSVRNGRIGITHGGGVASVGIEVLSEEQVKILNGTSSKVQISSDRDESMEKKEAGKLPVMAKGGESGARDLEEGTRRDETRKLSEDDAELQGRTRLEEVVTRMKIQTAELNERSKKETKSACEAAKAEAIAKAKTLGGEADRLVASLKEGLTGRLREKVEEAVKLNLVVTKKLKGMEWVGLKKYGGEAYEILGGSKDRDIGILVCFETQIESKGIVEMWVEKLGVETIEKEGGFDARVPVFGELSAEEGVKLDLVREKLEQIRRLREEQAGVVDLATNEAKRSTIRCEDESKAREVEVEVRATAFEKLEARLGWLYRVDEPRVSASLSRLGFKAGFRDPRWAKVKDAFNVKNFGDFVKELFEGRDLRIDEEYVEQISKVMAEREWHLVVESAQVSFNGTRMSSPGEKGGDILLVSMRVEDMEEPLRVVYPEGPHPDGHGLIFDVNVKSTWFVFRDFDRKVTERLRDIVESYNNDLKNAGQKVDLGELSDSEVQQMKQAWHGRIVEQLEKGLMEW